MVDKDARSTVLSDESNLTDKRFATLPRWWWIAMMAACLIGLFTKGYADEPVLIPSTIQLDAVLPGPIDLTAGETHSGSATVRRNGRPRFVDLAATLANFDRDADADGWIATIALRDATGQLVTQRSYATFELKPGRFAVDQVTFVAGEHVAQRWSKSLAFDADGVARVRLKLTGTAKNSIGELTMFSSTSLRSRSTYASGSTFGIQRLSSADRFRYTPTDGFIGPDFPFHPVLGALSVRVSVPTVGTFDSVTLVPLKTPVINLK